MDPTTERAQWIALRRAGLGSTSFALLVARFGSIAAAWEAPADDIGKAGLDAKFVRAFERARREFDADRELTALREAGVRALTWLDADYPSLLREIPQSPPVLFVQGRIGPQFEQAIAVVGTRRVTPYGRRAAEAFCATLAGLGVAIISGLARGIDAIAHETALVHGAPTAAVLAGGLDRIYPRENERLAARIREQGCLVSEYPLGIPARPDYFPRRNRILSGLARATLVVEAGTGSGALHTANWAFEQGRDVFAVPGSIFSEQSAGTNQLIREHTAKLVATPEQLCEELNLLRAGGQLPMPPGLEPSVPAGPEPEAGTPEARILELLQAQPMHVDELVRSTNLDIAEVIGAVQLLAIEGRVRESSPNVYERV
ncbi:MAG: DNA-processing protein DprA [Dehalococcoidia bacterium]|nr:DNA-processing protein DprA [Dehalococcoidia bacterium]